MNGGAWERVATYLDNKNESLLEYGNSTTDASVQYFNSDNELNSQYSAYWEKYDVSEEERTNQIKVSDTETITQDELWNGNQAYNEARQRLTNEIFNLMAKHKGIGVNEIAESSSYYGRNSSNAWAWLPSYIRTWENDYVLVGHVVYPFVIRGGSYDNTSGAGVFCLNYTDADSSNTNSFRPILAF